MATSAAVASATADVSKWSFAAVAAAGAKNTKTRQPAPRKQSTPTQQSQLSTRSRSNTVRSVAPPAKGGVQSNTTTSKVAETPPTEPNTSGQDELEEGVNKLELISSTPSLVINNASPPQANGKTLSNTTSAQALSDEASQKADSNSELGTKPPSLGDKSMTSGTTFNALDEKESLRPDDSASVKAAAEDDDGYSIRGSLAAISRLGSEVAPRVHRIQLGDMPLRSITSHPFARAIPESSSSNHSAEEVVTQAVASTPQPVTDAKMALVEGPTAPQNMYGQNPDEKLVEAMQSSKDRLFLLRLEQDLITFVQNSKEPYMDLPPSNSFCRLLSHKLADYYHMTHSFEMGIGCVRIYRTPFCRVPPPLASCISETPSESLAAAPAPLPRKIMRRGQGESGGASGDPSKPGSEVGSDSKDKAGREKLTREEREANYAKAREKIFGIPGEAAPDTEDGLGVSRTSSVSKERSNAGKRKTKQRRDDLDNFDSRSQYAPIYGHPQQPMWGPQQYYSVGQSGYVQGQQQQQPYMTTAPNVYPVAQAQGFSPTMANDGFAQQYQGPQGYSQMASQQRYPASTPMSQYPGGVSVNTPPEQWQQQPNGGQSPYGSQISSSGPGIPYAYGSFPAHMSPQDPHNQHPIPGSFNRHLLNPMTQSFVPGNGVSSMQQGAQFNGYVMQQQQQQPGAPIASPVMNYAAFSQPMPIQQQQSQQQTQYLSSVPAYGMVRQTSNGSTIPPYAVQQQQQQVVGQYAMMPQQMAPQTSSPPVQQQQQQRQYPVQQQQQQQQQQQTHYAQTNTRTGGYRNLPTYGNVASLPQKPTV